MNTSRQRRRRAVLTALLGLVATGAALVAGPAGTGHATPPTNPSDTQIKGAQATKAALAGKVGQLSAQIADKQAEIQQLDGQAELAEQKLANALTQLAQAKAAATAARARVVQAQAAIDKATQQFDAFVRSSYMSSPISPTTTSLLTATDPNALLQQGDYQRYSASHDLAVISDMNAATVEKSNADAAARAAVQRQTAATAAATRAKQQADAALQAAQVQKQQLGAQLSAQQSALDAAQSELATLNHQRGVYTAWKKRQDELAAERAAALARARAQAQAAAQQRDDSGGGGDGGGGGGGSFSPAPVPTGGSWSSSAGQNAVNRAMHYLGIAYAFAAGNFSGPTYGVCVSGDAWNDCNVFGFDCSGLSLYAWAPYIQLDHYAATQYSQAGSYHPSTSDLQPGDLVFWSSDGTQAGIHHVAIYIGNGNVIQAPQSGDIVRITPLGDVDSGYYGATRPLT